MKLCAITIKAVYIAHMYSRLVFARIVWSQYFKFDSIIAMFSNFNASITLSFIS